MTLTNYQNVPLVNLFSVSSGTRTSINLNSAYTYLSAGQSVAVRYQSRSYDQITEFYIFQDNLFGTTANIALTCYIVYEHTSSATQPGSTALDFSSAYTVTSTPAGWAKFTFPGAEVAAGRTLWFVIYNSAVAPTVDYPAILNATNTGGFPSTFTPGTGYSTVNGWSSAGTAQAELPFVVKQGSNYFGKPITSRGTVFGSNTSMRGIVVTPPVDISVAGFAVETGSTAFSGLRIYDDSTAPGGTPLYFWYLGLDYLELRDEIIGSKIFNAPYVLHGGQTYKVVLTYGANATLPACAVIEDYAAHSTMLDTFTDGFQMCAGCLEFGSSWTIYKNIIPALSLIIDGFVPHNSRASYAMGL